jgi:hypothetical protein
MSNKSKQSNAWSAFGDVVKGIKSQILLFALATVILIALLGTSIPSTFTLLIYIVVVGALVVTSIPEIQKSLRHSVSFGEVQPTPSVSPTSPPPDAQPILSDIPTSTPRPQNKKSPANKPLTAPTSSVASDMKQKYLDSLEEDLGAAYKQLANAISEVDRGRIQRQITDLEQKIAQVKKELERP